MLKENGKRPPTKSYMWLYRTGNDRKQPVILYDYRPSRNGDHAVTYMKDLKGYVYSDSYSGYNKLSGITRVAADSFSTMLLKMQSDPLPLTIRTGCYRIPQNELRPPRQSTASLKPQKQMD